MFRWFCIDCNESISLWPEFAVPYQPEPVETHEKAAVDYLNGVPIKDIATAIGYDPRTVSRWVHRIVDQAYLIHGFICPMVQQSAGELLPHYATSAFNAAKNLLASLRQHAEIIKFERVHHLMGLCNNLSKGRYIIWGGAIGRCRSSRAFIASCTCFTPP